MPISAGRKYGNVMVRKHRGLRGAEIERRFLERAIEALAGGR